MSGFDFDGRRVEFLMGSEKMKRVTMVVVVLLIVALSGMLCTSFLFLNDSLWIFHPHQKHQTPNQS